MNENMNDDYGKQDNRMHMNSLQPGGDKILKLRPENNKPAGGSMPPLNLTENITAQDRALSEQVGTYVIRYTEEFSTMHYIGMYDIDRV